MTKAERLSKAIESVSFLCFLLHAIACRPSVDLRLYPSFLSRSAAVASHVFLDAFQKVADAAISAKGREKPDSANRRGVDESVA